MINTKRPSTDDYTQVGFVEAKDTQGNYQNIDHIYDTQGNIVFQQGYLNEYQGADNFGIPAIGKPLLDYTIYGNMSQSGTPTQEIPIQPQETGDRTGNLFDPNSTRYYMGKGSNNRIGFVSNGAMFYIEAAPNTNYTIKIHTTDSTFVRLYLSNAPIVTSVGESYNVISESETTINPEVTISNTNYTYLWIQAGGTWYTEHGGSSIMLNTGDTALPYEPYGYKLDISSGGVNLAPPLTDWVDGYISSGNGGVHVPTETREKSSDFIRVEPNSVYVFSYENGNFPSGDSGAWRVAGLYDANKQFISRVGSANSLPLTITTTAETVYIRLSFRTYGGSENAMLNLGSTPLPYEPYNRTTTPVYLGEVESTRRIKKYEFTGNEKWLKGNYAPSGGYQFFAPKPSDIAGNPDWLMTHFKKGSGLNGSAFASYLSLYPEISTLPENATANDFKSWLAAQYAAGTPVTVWYVLAEPQTGIVNEPLRKIGDYADTLSMEQAGVEMPTIKGNTVIDVLTEVEPSEVDVTYRGSTKPKYNLFLAQNGDSFEAKDGQSLYIGGGL